MAVFLKFFLCFLVIGDLGGFNPATPYVLLDQAKPFAVSNVELMVKRWEGCTTEGQKVCQTYSKQYAWGQVLPSGAIRITMADYCRLFVGARKVEARARRWHHWYALFECDTLPHRTLPDSSVIIRPVRYYPWPRRSQRAKAWRY